MISLFLDQGFGAPLPAAPIYWLVLAVAFGFLYYQRNREREALLARARPQALRARVHPHFLFNTLHAVSALMEDDVKGARRMIARLSALLRESLAGEGHHRVPLGQELELLRLYFDIEQVRFADRMKVVWHLEGDALNALVPQLLLQPLTENAICHGIGRFLESGRIVVIAIREKGRPRLCIEDDGPGLSADASKAPKGLGLSITRERLHHMYGNDASLKLEKRASGGCRVSIGMPYQAALDLPRTELSPPQGINHGKTHRSHR